MQYAVSKSKSRPTYTTQYYYDVIDAIDAAATTTTRGSSDLRVYNIILECIRSDRRPLRGRAKKKVLIINEPRGTHVRLRIAVQVEHVGIRFPILIVVIDRR